MKLIDPCRESGFSLQRCLPPAGLVSHVDNFQHIQMPQAGPLPRILPGNGALCIIPCRSTLTLRDVHAGQQHVLDEAFILCNRHHVLDLSTDAPGQFFVISFRPGRLRHFGAACFADLQDRVTPAYDLWHQPVEPLSEQLADSAGLTESTGLLGHFLSGLIQQNRQSHFDALMDLLYLGPERRISDLADDAGLSLRQFERVFTSTYGVTPKFFARVARLQRVARKLALEPTSSAALSALDAGFFDQSHFVHELRKLADLSPAELACGMRERPHFYNPSSLQRYSALLGKVLNDRPRLC
ncbi:helix-turn-helix domain-containing protein [Uliginosibacterium sp. 31-16]|uniref:AraC family transcriptional regulator n=1 Tax=Uliginosibacterium sp. 31-16 TaxID=3068315 RepID=UPI00273EBA21|nr:helix-turn-helix domain-containing protein [Uliginosibacterium sp. 31-16]MDP5240711.1 helix-turn-helix domain-containing protein [Uliginosibacterium sp. 31-16]